MSGGLQAIDKLVVVVMRQRAEMLGLAFRHGIAERMTRLSEPPRTSDSGHAFDWSGTKRALFHTDAGHQVLVHTLLQSYAAAAAGREAT
jgi:hypothetical protein